MQQCSKKQENDNYITLDHYFLYATENNN